MCRVFLYLPVMENPTIPGLDIPVQTIYCIGRNYANHAKEMGSDIPEKPLVFLKPTGTVCYKNTVIQLPDESKDVHFEAEIVVAISKTGKNIPQNEALDYIAGIGPGIDFTARDIQREAKKKGHPWSVAKGFDQFAPIGEFVPVSEIENPENLDIKLFQNGFIKQHGNSSEMIFPINQLISYLSGIFTLYPGDLIFTGTPAGVGPVQTGDILEVHFHDQSHNLTVEIG